MTSSSFWGESDRTLRLSDGTCVTLQRTVATSGEGVIYATDQPIMLAKVYHETSLDRARKLETMLASPPEDPTQPYGHLSIAWPRELLLDKQGAVQGFLMPKIRGARQLSHVSNPRLRRQNAPAFNWYYLHTTALNTAWILKSLHAHGYVVGDLKLENFLVNDKALVSILDTDSFQIQSSQTSEVFRCPVGSEGFTPRELMGKDLAQETRTEIHDRFGLGVLIYLLLFGMHPFSGVWSMEGEAPNLDERIWKGWFPFSKGSILTPSPLSFPLEILPPALEEAFRRTFVHGHKDPEQRPSAHEWVELLTASLGQLELCSQNEGHFYYARQGRCPWCARLEKTGYDLFPIEPAQTHENPFLLEKRFEKAMREGKLEVMKVLLSHLERFLSPEALGKRQEELVQTAEIVEVLERVGAHIAQRSSHRLLSILTPYLKTQHPVLNHPHPAFNWLSPVVWAQGAVKVEDIKEKLRDFEAKHSGKPYGVLTDFETLLRLWDPEFGGDQDFENIATRVPEAQDLFDKYRALKDYVRVGNAPKLFELWHPLFEEKLIEDGLWHPFLASVQLYFRENPMHFAEGVFPLVCKEFPGEGILVSIPLPVADDPFLDRLTTGVFIQEDLGVPGIFLPQKTIRDQGNFLFLAENNDHTFQTLSVAPAVRMGNTPLVTGAFERLRTHKKAAEIFFSVSVRKRTQRVLGSINKRIMNLDLCIWTHHEDGFSLPPLLLRAGREGIPLPEKMSADNALTLMKLPPIILEKDIPWFQTFSFECGTESKAFFKKSQIILEVDPGHKSGIDPIFFFSSMTARRILGNRRK